MFITMSSLFLYLCCSNTAHRSDPRGSRTVLGGSGSSYHFLHKTEQEFMAVLHVSSLPPGERAEFERTSFGKSNMTMVVRFMAGLTKFQSQVM